MKSFLPRQIPFILFRRRVAVPLQYPSVYGKHISHKPPLLRSYYKNSVFALGSSTYDRQSTFSSLKIHKFPEGASSLPIEFNPRGHIGFSIMFRCLSRAAFFPLPRTQSPIFHQGEQRLLFFFHLTRGFPRVFPLDPLFFCFGFISTMLPRPAFFFSETRRVLRSSPPRAETLDLIYPPSFDLPLFFPHERHRLPFADPMNEYSPEPAPRRR